MFERHPKNDLCFQTNLTELDDHDTIVQVQEITNVGKSSSSAEARSNNFAAGGRQAYFIKGHRMSDAFSEFPHTLLKIKYQVYLNNVSRQRHFFRITK